MNKFMTGALLGLAIGLLIAPEKGEDLRNDLADRADDLKNRFNRMVGRAAHNLDDLRALLEENIDGLSDDVKHRIRTIIDEAEDMAYSSRSSLTNGAI